MIIRFLFTSLVFLFGTGNFPAACAGERSISQSATASAANSQANNAGHDLVVNNNYSLRSQRPIDVVGTKVAITSAYLVPSIYFYRRTLGPDTGGVMVKNNLYDSMFLCVEVANISSQPLLVTAMRLNVDNPGNLQFGPAELFGCPGEHVSSVTPECLLQPGQRKRWLLKRGVVIPGVVDFLKRQEGEYVFDDVHPNRTGDDAVIGRFNDFIRSAIGSDATLKVSIFERDYQPILTGYFQLTQGADLFATEPRVRKVAGRPQLVFPLQHDAFLGEALSQLREKRRTSPGEVCQSNAAQ